ncbi:MAG: exodeoxyribonuclease VII large subunit [bacterium]
MDQHQQEISQKLMVWRAEMARKNGIEVFKILQNATIDALVHVLPRTREELAEIKGIGPKKLHDFGDVILAIIHGTAGDNNLDDEGQDNQEFSVSAFLDRLTHAVCESSKNVAAVRGEISEISIRQQGVFMTLKDADGSSILHCYISPWVYGELNFSLQEGMEIKISGSASIYKPYGRLSFVVRHVELTGEGALRKAYELLKDKLEKEGIFERKRVLPEYIQNIGIITSRSGAVIDDFRTNLDKMNLTLSLYSVNVEGMYAASDIVKAIAWFNRNMSQLDILVIIRGGGSLESMQAFNTEKVARAIFASKIPTICGIGHDKDIPIASLVGDKETSTPSIAAMIINKSWDGIRTKLPIFEHRLLTAYEDVLSEKNALLSERMETLMGYFRSIFVKFRSLDNQFHGYVTRSLMACRTFSTQVFVIEKNMFRLFNQMLLRVDRNIISYATYLDSVNPERNLKLGYSIIRTRKGEIVRSIGDVIVGDCITTQLFDGSITAKVEEKKQNI